MPKESVEVTIEGFSGPLDLLCHMVESRQIQASAIKMTQLVRIYGAYLSKTKKASAEALAEFFYMAASLLLQKALSLLPNPGQEEYADEGEDAPMDEEELLARLARYRPYRTATAWLEDRKARKDRYYRRSVPEENAQSQLPREEPRYDIGDLYFLSRIWWGLLEKFSLGKKRFVPDFAPEEEWDGIPESLPEETQIQSRIAELEEMLAAGSELSLFALWALSPSAKMLVVTLLAVLEMCRMGKAAIEQEVLFSDVKIFAKK